MGGTVIETESDKIKIRTIIELGQEVGLDDSEILKILKVATCHNFLEGGIHE